MPRGTDIARVIQVIETRSCRGNGTKEDPCRVVIQYWTLNGEMLAEKDNINENTVLEQKT
jgi:hypothetical protein